MTKTFNFNDRQSEFSISMMAIVLLQVFKHERISWGCTTRNNSICAVSYPNTYIAIQMFSSCIIVDTNCDHGEDDFICNYIKYMTEGGGTCRSILYGLGLTVSLFTILLGIILFIVSIFMIFVNMDNWWISVISLSMILPFISLTKYILDLIECKKCLLRSNKCENVA